MATTTGQVSSSGQMYLTMQQKSADEGGNHSIVNLNDALEAGSAMDKQSQMRKIKEKMSSLTRTVYSPNRDP